MNEEVIANTGSLAMSQETLRAFAKGQLDEATEQQVLALLDTRPDLAAQVAAISSDSILAKMKNHSLMAEPQSSSSQLASANQEDPPPRETTTAIEPPTELAELNGYKLIKEIGRGGMGVVYLAEHVLTGRKEVLKVLNERLMTNNEARKRFDQETKCIAALNHETIVSCYTVQQLPSTLVLCMEYVPGINLHHYIQTHGQLPIRVACGIAAEVCRGLQHAMDNGLVHRDIKPSNIMLHEADGKLKAKILDFGLARLSPRESDGNRRQGRGLTDDGTLLGTLEYISPEQCLSAASADIRSDIYSLGCTLYHMLAGHPPFSGSTGELVLAHTQTSPPAINLLRPDVPNELASVLTKMLAKKPSQRFPTPRDVISDLQPFINQKKSAANAQNPESADHAPDTLPSVSSMKADTHFDSQNESAAANRAISTPTMPADLVAPNPSKSAAIPKTQKAGQGRGTYGKRIALAVIPLLLVTLFSIGTLLIKTPHGTIAFEGLPDNAQIAIDGQTVTATWSDGQALVDVTPGKRQVKVTTDGTTVVGEQVSISTDENKTIRISTESADNAAKANAKPSDPPEPGGEHHELPNAQPTTAVVPFSNATAARLQQHWADFLGVPVFFTDRRGITFRLIPPGQFITGSTPLEIDQAISLAHANADWSKFIQSESPRQTVAITRPFYLATTEITQLQFQSVCSYNPSKYSPEGHEKHRIRGIETANLPVEHLSHSEAIEFCSRLNHYYKLAQHNTTPTYNHNALGYRLPTEAEWEFACRAGSDQAFWNGESPTAIALAENLNRKIGMPQAAGESTANPFGLYDMHGNVREHVADFFIARGDSEDSERVIVDPITKPSNSLKQSIIRGGDYYFTPLIGRASSRYGSLADEPALYTTGFRVAMSVETYRRLNQYRPQAGVKEYVALHGANKAEFHRWLQAIEDRYIPISVNLRHGAAEHLHDAVAVNKPTATTFLWTKLANDRAAGASYLRFHNRLQPHWKLIYPTSGKPPMDCENSVLWRSSGVPHWETRNIGNIPPDTRMKPNLKGGQIPVSICVVHSDGKRNTHIKLVRRPGIGNRAFSALSLEQLEAEIEKCRKQNWRPSMLQIQAGSKEPTFAAVFRENSAQLAWDFTLNKSVEDFEQELERRRQANYYPGGLASFVVDDKTKFVVVWLSNEISPLP